MKKLLSMSLLLLATIRLFAASEQTGIKLWGSNYVDIAAFHFLNNSTDDSLKIGGMNTVSLKFHNSNKHYGKFEGNIDLLIPLGYTADQFSQLIEEGDSLSSPFYPLFVQGNTPVLLDIRKLYLSVYLPFADIMLGRQIINFGKAFIFSPIDVFSTVDVADINFRRHGSDVTAIKIPFSFLSGMDLITEFPRKHHEYSSAFRIYHNMWDFDFAANAIYKHRNKEVITGFSFKGDAFFGIYGELIEHFMDNFEKKYFEGMFGLDYSIANTYIFRTEYYYKNSNINNEWGKHNLFISFQYLINDLLNVSIHTIGSDVGGNEQMLMYMGQCNYNILQNVNLITYARYFSQKNEVKTLPDVEYAVRIEVKF
ncbi:MAG TPA: hypothetical protein ENG70_01210 [Candidatus Cloacimonetes bacterium]|nr:hypothetical protein [Candidatus Cloacimonadota bacterium]HEX37469.1 hypothetical protein [Candidatus Cloacimonadota bacterium]